MKILVAPDKFKGSLSSKELCEAIAIGIKKYDDNINVITHPLADGGDGSLEVLEQHLNLETITLKVNDPLFRPINASYKKTKDSAYIEMATASGLVLLAPNEQNCMFTTTYGTGELILDAIKRGVTKVYLSIGGSATCDAGIGIAAALGFSFKDQNNEILKPIGKNLEKIAFISPPNDTTLINRVKFNTLCDVNNPLFGKQGAAYVFAAQKGANRKEIKILDRGLKHFSELVKQQLHKEIALTPGAGAAGGLGGGSVAFLNATLQSGTDMMFRVTKFPEALKNTDLIFTGEGKIDQQTLNGKVIYGVSKLAKTKNIPVYVISGASDLSKSELEHLGIEQLRTVVSASTSEEEAFSNTKNIVAKLAYEMTRDRLSE
ncbi:glycerate kinase [Aquimarina gracilis]|uniref:Glycerate kinase n=1 Tax=Aquimarina gracilis TaxID=874422 RepID=A0ABU5ZWS9_9FLAO|nr:glycerate kinase [Aquimarina gracilis]MEB3346297.1 glycerate kinase [Aquimarina gracilis]